MRQELQMFVSSAPHRNRDQWVKGFFIHKCRKCRNTTSRLGDPNSRWPPFLPSSISFFLCKSLSSFPNKGSLRGNERNRSQFCSSGLSSTSWPIWDSRRIVHILSVQCYLGGMIFIMDCFSFDNVPRHLLYFKIHPTFNKIPKFLKVAHLQNWKEECLDIIGSECSRVQLAKLLVGRLLQTLIWLPRNTSTA